GAAVTLFPLLWMVAASVMPAGESTAGGLRLVPTTVTLVHYRTVFARLHLARAFANSVGLAVAVTAIALVVNSMAGYAFAKLRFPGRDRIFQGRLSALVIPSR